VTTTTRSNPATASLTQKGGGKTSDRVFHGVALAAGLLVLAILALILIITVKESLPVFQKEGIRFFTSKTWIPNDPDGPDGPRTAQFGALAFIYGTVVVSLLSLIIAVPIAVGIALFLTELAPRRVRSFVVTVIDLLAAIPSVVFGLWGIIVLGPFLVPIYRWLHGLVDGVPVLGTVIGVPVSSGRVLMTAGIIVAVMIIPIITSITREVFATVPTAEKHAALALGATKWEMIKGVVFPHSFGGMVGAVMLGLGRAMGETIAVALVIGAAVQISPNLFSAGDALPAIIVRNWGESSGVYQAALVGCAVVLFLITVIINYLARIVVGRAEARLKGAAA
jgi:phosphate transport system permease protein